MALIISILISLGVITSAEQITDQIISDYQTEISEVIIEDSEID